MSAAREVLTRDVGLELYGSMVRIRAFEDAVYRCLLEGLVPGTTHLCQGQEAVSVGTTSVLRDDDYLSYTYRGHGHCIARGMDPERAFAELFGRDTGVSAGLGGSMHLTDPALGLVGSFGIVGAGIPFAVGCAFAARRAGRGQVSVAYFGDGATNIGAFHEAMNLAAVWQAPALFVCENNLYGEYSRIDRTTPFEDLHRRADAYAMASGVVDGNDVMAVRAAAAAAVERARDGGGPFFLECKTYRQRGHSRTDPAKYRPAAEVEQWLARDPIERFADRLVGDDIVTREDLDDCAAGIIAAIDSAVAAAKAAPEPVYDAAALKEATYA